MIHVALLRGINVGGKNRVAMKPLAEMFADAGCRDVRTYIQSGNVVFAADARTARALPAAISGALERRLGLKIPVVTRSAAELRAVAEGNPWLREGVEVEGLHVGFLAERPGSDAVARLDPEHSPPDRYLVRGREIFLHYPEGLGRSRLTNQYFDSRLGTVCTVRNWRTVLKLVELCGAT